MVKKIKYLRLNLNCLVLGNVKRSGQTEVNFVDPRPIEGIVADAWDRAGTSNTQGRVARRFIDRAVVQGVVSVRAATKEINTGARASQQTRIGSSGIKLH